MPKTLKHLPGGAPVLRPLLVVLFTAAAAFAQLPPEQDRNQSTVFLRDNIERPLRYTPDGTDFVITNGVEFFNRPLYGGNTPFRFDGGDKPEFSLYLPGRGGNLRLGIKTSAGVKWLNDFEHIVTRYRPGSLIYEIRDPLLGQRVLHLTALPLSGTRDLIVRAKMNSAWMPIELVWAFGGANGMKGRRSGDIGCEREPVSEFFQLRPDQCRDHTFTIAGNTFTARSKTATIAGVASGQSTFAVGDARQWADAGALLESTPSTNALAVLVGRATIDHNVPVYIALQHDTGTPASLRAEDLPKLFSDAEEHRRAIAERVIVETPDPFINAAAAALNIAADAVWDERQQAFMHGAVAWRVRLLGWRSAYAGDTLGWHERTAAHFAGFAKQQITDPIPDQIPPADEDSNLARSENALHSNGAMTKSHYDMNLVGVDAFFRHLLWTGNLDYAREMWPVIERHLAWERRLFRREFGENKLPLYEGYANFWASDDVAYNGGGAAHSSAYNAFHNRMAARVAKLLGKDASLYEREADLIAQAMREELWLEDRGWFGEWKDLLGKQLVHPNAAAWSFYHTMDCGVPTPVEAWQMTRAMDTQFARFPLRGPGVPDGCHSMPSSSWMPYSWSVNNVVLAEVMHTSLAYWQAGRADGALPLFKGAVLDSMFMGLCPGNVGMATWFDTYRRESQRDFADGVGAMSRALVEGLFGVQPDALAGELNLRPGFPGDWTNASIRHPDFNFTFRRDGLKESFVIEQQFYEPMALRLQIPALLDRIASVMVNGKRTSYTTSGRAIGAPQIEIKADAATKIEVLVEWRGQEIAAQTQPDLSVAQGMELNVQTGGEQLLTVEDPQGSLSEVVTAKSGFRAKATGTPGHRTVFAQVRQGELQWRQPVTFEIREAAEADAPVDWNKPLLNSVQLDTVDLANLFNDTVTQIFRNEYRSPRSPFCSLATPTQGIGTWCHPKDQFDVDDSGLRKAAADAGGKVVLPNGIPLATPVAADAKNVAFVSQWDNYPNELTVPLSGKSTHAYLLMAGSTSAMQSRFDNGDVIVEYTDGSSARLALHNPTTWWPIDQDYYIDDFAFARPEPLPVRIDLKTGKVRVLEMDSFKGTGGKIPGGAATVLDVPLDPAKELKSLTVRALANEVVIGLMSVTLQR